MADCPGLVHLALMADGGLARLRIPGGALSAAEARAVADAAERLGSREIDLTNRANLQIRGVRPGAERALADALAAAGFTFHGEADRRRNILLDPFSGLDVAEERDFRPLGRALDAALVSAPWIGRLSPKFSFVLDGGGLSRISAVPSDVVALASGDGVVVSAAGSRVVAMTENAALAALLALAEAAASDGPGSRAADIPSAALRDALGRGGAPVGPDGAARPVLAPRFGAVRGRDGTVALSIPAPVGRIDAGMLRFLADIAEAEGEGRLVLAPWSAVLAPGVRVDRAAGQLRASEARGFTPVAVAERLSVTACAGAPACERAREPAKALGAAILDLAAREPVRLGTGRRSVHLSACPKGCAGSAPADLLLVGSSDGPGWSVHAGGSPRAPGRSLGRADSVDPADLLARLSD